MRKFVGFLLLIAGVAFGVFAYFPGSLDREQKLAEITEILAAPAGDVSRRTPESAEPPRSFAPKQQIIIEKPAQAPAASAPAQVAAAPLPTPPPQINGWQAIVTSDTAVPAGVTSTKPGDGPARYELTMNIQRELKRAGCYGGALNGSWNANTKRAMSAFMERVNSTLPTSEPDYILLTLLKGHTAATCVTCPAGQSLSSEGRCLPNAIIAQRKVPHGEESRKSEMAAKPAEKPAAHSGFTTTTAVAEADTRIVVPLPGRMSMGGPKVDVPSAAPAAPASESWNVRIIPTPRVPPAAVLATEVPKATTAPAPAPVTAPATQAPAPAPAAQPAVPPRTKTAALLDEVAEPAGDAPVQDQSPNAAPAQRAMPVPGLPGSKAGRTVNPPREYAPPPSRPSVAVSPRRERAAQRARPTRQARGVAVRGTRSVQSLFTHPLGRM
jgi:hypothetical protein